MPMEISQSFYNSLLFDLDAALADYTAAKEAHKTTVGVAAPTADPVVEAIYYAGGYTIVAPPPPPVDPLNPLFDMGPTMNQILTS